MSTPKDEMYIPIVAAYLQSLEALGGLKWLINRMDNSLSLAEPLKAKEELYGPREIIENMLPEDFRDKVILRESSRGGWIINLPPIILAQLAIAIEKQQVVEMVRNVKEFLSKQSGLEDLSWTTRTGDLSLSLSIPKLNEAELIKPYIDLQKILGAASKEVTLRPSSRGGWVLNISPAGLQQLNILAKMSAHENRRSSGQELRF